MKIIITFYLALLLMFFVLVDNVMTTTQKATRSSPETKVSEFGAVEHMNFIKTKTDTDKKLENIKKFTRKYWAIIKKKANYWYDRFNKEFEGLFSEKTYKKNVNAMGKEVRTFIPEKTDKKSR